MCEDARIRPALATLMANITPPPIPLSPILRRASQPAPTPKTVRRLQPALAAATIIGVVAVATPLLAPGLVESVEMRVAQILQWTPPRVPPPQWMTSQMRAQAATLASAQTRASFTIVLPMGLPRDVTSSAIATAPSGIYDKAAHTWQLGTQVVYFTYRRAGGRSFTLLADRFDTRTGPPSGHMFEDTGKVRDGMPVLIRHAAFEWRNGDQVMKAVAGAGITATEIAKIRNAMHGVSIAPAQNRRARESGTIDKMYAAP